MAKLQKISQIKLTLDINKLIIILLLAIVSIMLVVWKPWAAPSNRTVYVVGEAKIKAEPDEFVFYPNYQFENADRAVALKELGAKSNEIVTQLKALGVAENKIKTDTNGSDYKAFYPSDRDSAPTYLLTFTITVSSRDVAQKVSDYLVSTSPLGSVSPQPGFSDTKRKELETQARDVAVKDARKKAEQNARNTGARLGKVKEISDGEGFNNDVPIPYGGTAISSRGAAEDMSLSSLSVLPGETEIRYTVHVTYFAR